MFSWAVCDRDGRYLTISVKRTTSTKIKKLNIAPSFINMNLFELENSHFMLDQTYMIIKILQLHSAATV